MGDYYFSGLQVSTNAATSTAVSISAGSAFLQGFQILESATGSLNTATSATNFIYIVLTLDASNRPTSVAYVATTAESTVNAMRIAKVISTTKVSSVDVGNFGAAMSPFNTIQLVNHQLGGIF